VRNGKRDRGSTSARYGVRLTMTGIGNPNQRRGGGGSQLGKEK